MGLLALLFTGVVGLDNSISPGGVERHLEEAIRSHLPDVGRVGVAVGTRGLMRTTNGDFGRVELELRDFRLEKLSLGALATVQPRRHAPSARASSAATSGDGWRRRIGPSLGPPQMPDFRFPEESSIGSVGIVATDFTYAGLPLDRLTVELTGVRYSPRQFFTTGKIAVRRLDDGRGEFQVGPQAVRELITREDANLREVVVRFRDERIEISAKLLVLFVPVPFSCTARVECRDSQTLILVDPVARIGALRLPAKAAKAILDALGAAIHVPLDALAPLQAAIDGVTLTPEGMTVRARLWLGDEKT